MRGLATDRAIGSTVILRPFERCPPRGPARAFVFDGVAAEQRGDHFSGKPPKDEYANQKDDQERHQRRRSDLHAGALCARDQGPQKADGAGAGRKHCPPLDGCSGRVHALKGAKR